MRCKVPAASGPRSLQATHAPPRRPEVTPAAHTDRMLQTPPDIATRSQSAGRSVNRPDALLHRPPGGHRPSWSSTFLLWSIPGRWQLPPTWGQSLHQGRVLRLPRGPPNPRAGLPAHHTRDVPVFALSFLESLFLFSGAGAADPFSRCKQMPKCLHQLLPSLPPPSTGPPFIPGSCRDSPGLQTLGSAPCLNCPS